MLLAPHYSSLTEIALIVLITQKKQAHNVSVVGLNGGEGEIRTANFYLFFNGI